VDTRRDLIDYPTEYAFKVMGKQAPDFVELVRALFLKVEGVELAADAVAEKASQKGNYLSLTVTVRLESEAQRQRIYAELHREARVLYYL
jgi:uncharacterized protein